LSSVRQGTNETGWTAKLVLQPGYVLCALFARRKSVGGGRNPLINTAHHGEEAGHEHNQSDQYQAETRV
jgi:hypothetical protein